jgi:hypothetical protein
LQNYVRKNDEQNSEQIKPPMKKIFCAALVLISVYAKAGTCTALGNGNWENAANWSCGNIPGAGDNVSIPAGITITVNANNTTPINNLDIFGTLVFTNGSKINLTSTSVVDIFSGGSITGGNGGAKLVFASGNSYSGPFSTTGTFYFSSGGSGTGLLGLTLVSFYSVQQNQDVVLYWKTENEDNSNSFVIESSGSGKADWDDMATIPAIAGNGNGSSYSFTDRNKLMGDRYYRLRIVDNNGGFVYSKVLFVSSTQASAISITPTLVSSSINVSLPVSGQAQVSIYNTSGLLVKTLITENSVSSVDVSSLSRGAYFVKASQGNNTYSTKFLKL